MCVCVYVVRVCVCARGECVCVHAHGKSVCVCVHVVSVCVCWCSSLKLLASVSLQKPEIVITNTQSFDIIF